MASATSFDMELVQAREEAKAALADLRAAAAAIDKAGASADVAALQATFDAAEAAYTQAKRNYRLAESASFARTLGARGARVTGEPLTYERGGPHSVFRDVLHASRGDLDAAKRLDAHKQEIRRERPDAQFDLSSTDAAGGYLVAPLYLQDDFVTFARARAATIAALGTRPLPPNTDSINVPTMATGTATAVQAADNAAIQETDATFGTTAADVKTIAGLQDVSRQVVDRGVPGTDEVIFNDLASDFAAKWDTQVLTSATANFRGLLNVPGLNAVTYSDASPTVGELYPKLADALQQIATGIFAPATHMLMHPRRWAWFLAAVDTAGRPFVVPDPQGPNNSAAVTAAVMADGAVGSIHSLPVYTDANIPTNLGAGTNEDRIIVVHAPELRVWQAEQGPFLERFDDVGSATLTVRFRLHSYVAQSFERRPKAISVISGTGLATPTF